MAPFSTGGSWLPVFCAGGAALLVAGTAYVQASAALRAAEEAERSEVAVKLRDDAPKQICRAVERGDSEIDSPPSSTRESTSGSSPCMQCGAHAAPLRCSRCHDARYCSQACQRLAWPQHKQGCGKGSIIQTPSNAAPVAQQQQQQEQPEQPEQLVDAGGSMDVLRGFLAQHAASRSDPLQRAFEQAVLLFVQGEHAKAATALAAVRASAEGAGELGIAGDACRWAGHAHAKLGEAGKAATAFAAGCQLGERAGSRKLQIDCLSGMGSMHRDAGQLAAAAGFMRQALRIAQAHGDDALRASCLTQLGGVLAASEPVEAVALLEEAVGLREDQVVSLHESGKRGAALATAIMEHAGSLVSLAGVYHVLKRHEAAAEAYGKSLAVFELVGDEEKAAKCLINLANLQELQLTGDAARADAAASRARLYAARPSGAPDACAACAAPLAPLAPTSGDDDRLLLLGCLHCLHLRCYEAWSEEHDVGCPACKPQPTTPADGRP